MGEKNTPHVLLRAVLVLVVVGLGLLLNILFIMAVLGVGTPTAAALVRIWTGTRSVDRAV